MYSKFQDSPNVNWFGFKKKKDSNPNFPEVLKTFMGRDALNIYLWNIKDPNKKQKVLLPAYVCTEVSDQFKRNGIDIIYYDIKNFQIQVEDIKPYLEDEIDIFYFVQYFGIYQKNLEEIISTVKEKNPKTIIIEDRAHYLTDDYIIDEIDAVIYSFRKLLPIPEGGGVYSRQKLIYRPKPRIISNILVLLVLLKKKIFGHNPKFSRSNVMKDVQKPSNELLLPSTFSEKVINYYDLKEERKLRRELFNLYSILIKDAGIEPVFSELSEKDIPQGFPIYVENAEKVFNKMYDEGIYLKRHWVLPEKLKSIAPNSYAISEKVITLPIYENINKEDINFLIEKLKSIL